MPANLTAALSAAGLLLLIARPQPGSMVGAQERSRSQSERTETIPTFEYDPTWPKPLPENHLLLGKRPCSEQAMAKALKPRVRRWLGEWTQVSFQVSQRQAARLLPMSRSTLRYVARRDTQLALRTIRDTRKGRCLEVNVVRVPGPADVRVRGRRGPAPRTATLDLADSPGSGPLIGIWIGCEG